MLTVFNCLRNFQRRFSVVFDILNLTRTELSQRNPENHETEETGSRSDSVTFNPNHN
jgi:hypothetical protein